MQRTRGGGTDCRCETLSDLDNPDEPWWHLDTMVENNSSIPGFGEKLEKAKNLDRHWSFHCSKGQPAIIHISYGFIAAVVAELTNGFLWSEDDAWDPERFPSEHVDFLTWYFRSEQALSPETQHWAEHCVALVAEELSAQYPEHAWWRKIIRRS